MSFMRVPFTISTNAGVVRSFRGVGVAEKVK